MKYILLVLAFCLAHNLSAQDFAYPLAVGDRWLFAQILPNLQTGHSQLDVKSDSVMPNGHSYASLSDCQFLRQQSNHVLVFTPVDNREHIMYDFSRSIGDTVGNYPQWYVTFDVVLRDTGSLFAYGHRRRYITFYKTARSPLTDMNVSERILDGIGPIAFEGSNGPWSLVGALISETTYGTLVGIADSHSSQPLTIRLYQNYPNPFNPSTTISYRLPTASRVTVRVFNALGQEAALLVDELKQAGVYQVRWTANVPSGIYFYRILTAQYSECKKMVVLH